MCDWLVYCWHYWTYDVTKYFEFQQHQHIPPCCDVIILTGDLSVWRQDNQPCLERMIGGCLDWSSLRSLILEFVIHHKSSRPNTVNPSFPYHLLWSFIQITIIASSWPVLLGGTPLWQCRDERWVGAPTDILITARTERSLTKPLHSSSHLRLCDGGVCHSPGAATSGQY